MLHIDVYDAVEDRELRLSPHFKVKELASRDGARPVVLDPRLPVVLEAIRSLAGKPLHINSGYRSPSHNAKVGGNPRSRHMYGQAADVRCPGLTPDELGRLAEQVMPDWGGIGVYAKKGFVHVDVRPERSRWRE